MNIFSLLNYILSIISISAYTLSFFRLYTAMVPFTKILQLIDIVIGTIFVLEIIIRIFTSDKPSAYLKKYWYELGVSLYLVCCFLDFFALYSQTTIAITIIRILVIIYMLTTRGVIAHYFFSNFSAQPARLMFATFLTTIGVGTLLLMNPAATIPGQVTSFVDALFTATSATCVTGLAVQDTAIHFTMFGQFVILLLIQIGGLGFMTFSAFLILVTRKNIQMHHRIVISDMLSQESLFETTRIIRAMILITFTIEFAGAFALFFFWWPQFPNYFQTLYYCFFHAISAFCNAGFSTFSTNLVAYQAHIPTNTIICLLIISGGLGFPVMVDLLENFRNKLVKRPRSLFRLRVQTKIVLTMTFILIIGGAGTIFFFQFYSNPYSMHLQMKPSILTAIFQSVSARTAGFNTCDIGNLSEGSLLTLMVLMFIGASPISTAGGIKTTTLAVLWAVARTSLLQRDQVEIFRRTIPEETIQKAITLTFFYLLIILVFLFFLIHIESRRIMILPLMFESISAIGTVGLSMGITQSLSEMSKFAITILMFIGRLGPLTIAYVFLLERKRKNYRYAEEKVLIG